MIVTTTNTVEGSLTSADKDVVVGEAIMEADLVSDVLTVSSEIRSIC